MLFAFSASMPRRTGLQSLLILGSGPIVIGQAAESASSGHPLLSGRVYWPILAGGNPAATV
ncbi:MAG TPA: hypothetical protein VF665_01290 [Longimicrobium sp.]|uniref:hypothetical protein n=1 Tax=Longimicrobium sp. TaxID=2029185 RepID=UPI002ED8D560